MTETFSNKDENGKKSVVLIEYPRKGVWAVEQLWRITPQHLQPT